MDQNIDVGHSIISFPEEISPLLKIFLQNMRQIEFSGKIWSDQPDIYPGSELGKQGKNVETSPSEVQVWWRGSKIGGQEKVQDSLNMPGERRNK